MCPRRPIPLAAFAAALVAVAATAAPAPAAPSAVVATLAPGTRASALGPDARPALAPALVARLEARIGRGRPELRRLYRLEVAGPAQAHRLARRLNARAGVEAAPEPQPVAPPAAVCRLPPAGGWPAFSPDAPSADLTGLQDYRDGLAIPADATGAGARIADVEYDWRPTHEELSAHALPAPVQPPGGLPPEFQAEDHGTAVLGVLGADADGHGITGLAPAAELRPLSPFLAANPSRLDIERAILKAAAGLRPGDVLLIEQQIPAWTTSNTEAYAPVEVHLPVREVIRAVVDAGIVVVEPAGNKLPAADSGIDLATLGVPWLADPSSPENSGALIVGAGGSSGAGPDRDLGRAAVSNFGARVDVQGYGEGVVTSGYGQLGPQGLPDRRYTACFDGTSSAAATVAGAIAALQGLVIAQGRPPLTPAQVRAALIATGRPQASLDGEPIGPRPQVAAAAAMVLDTGGSPQPAPGGGVAPGPTPPPATGAGGPPAPPGGASATVRRTALGGLAARLDRRSRRLTIRVRGLAPRAVVTVGGRRVRVARGAIVLADVRPGRLVVRASAPSRRRVAYRPARYVIVVPRSGPARVIGR